MEVYDAKSYTDWLIKATATIKEQLEQDIQVYGQASLGLSGGSTPYPVYEALAQDVGIDWSKVSLVEVDERYVSTENPEYNWTKIRESFGEVVLSQVSDEIFFDTTVSRQESVQRIQGQLPPRLSVCVLGMGLDGHIASLFPGGVWDNGSHTLATEAPEGYPTQARLSLSSEYILASKSIVVLIQGNPKRELLETMLEDDSSPLPIALLKDHLKTEVIAFAEPIAK